MKSGDAVRALAVTLLLAAWPAPLCGALLTNLPAADTTLFELVPDHNLGGDASTAAGRTRNGSRTRMILRFDLGAIPPGAQIHAVTLTIAVTRVPAQTTPIPSFFALHRLLRPWNEGSKSGALGQPASPGEATWNSIAHGSLAWSAPGTAAPTDFNATATGLTATAVDGFGSYIFNSASGLVADVQAWVNNPGANHGWVMISRGEATNATARRFGAREDPANAPQLVVDYTAPPPVTAVDITAVDRVGDTFRIHFTALAGQNYTLQGRNSLSVGTWLTLTNIPAPPAATNVMLSDALGPHTNRFYRVTAP